MKLFLFCLIFFAGIFAVDAFCSQEKHTGFFGGLEDKFCALFGHPHHDDEKIPPIHPDDHKPLSTSTEKQTTIKPEDGGKSSNFQNDPNDNKKPPKKTTKQTTKKTTKKTSKAPIHSDDHIPLPTEKQPKINAGSFEENDNSKPRSDSNVNKKPPKKTTKAPKITSVTIGGEEDDY